MQKDYDHPGSYFNEIFYSQGVSVLNSTPVTEPIWKSVKIKEPVYEDNIKSNAERFAQLAKEKKEEYNELVERINKLKSDPDYEKYTQFLADIKHSIRKEQRQLNRLTEEREIRKKEVVKLESREKDISRRIAILNEKLDKIIQKYLNPEDFAEAHYDPDTVVPNPGELPDFQELTFLQRLKLLFL